MPSRSPVPALPALTGIKDPNVLHALQSICSLLLVRNGDTGPSEDRFVTIGDLNLAGVDVSKLITATPNADQSIGTPNSLVLANVARNISALEDSVRASPFFTALRSRLERLAKRGAAIETKQETLQSAFASLARMRTILQAEVGDQLVLLEQLSQVTADLDGNISAQWTVKIDANGYVSGFGLSTTASNSTPYSEFYIAADKFAIGSPSVPRTVSGGSLTAPSTANVPFIVITTPITLNGKTVPVGVYMRDAFIQNGSIVTAMIGDLQVDTIAIQNNAVTVPVIMDQAGSLTVSTTYQTLVSGSVTYTAGSVPTNTFFVASMNVLVTDPGGGATFRVGLYINGSLIAEYGMVAATGLSFAPCVSKAVSSGVMGAGSHTIELKVKYDVAPTTAWTVQNGTLYSNGGKK